MTRCPSLQRAQLRCAGPCLHSLSLGSLESTAQARFLCLVWQSSSHPSSPNSPGRGRPGSGQQRQPQWWWRQQLRRGASCPPPPPSQGCGVRAGGWAPPGGRVDGGWQRGRGAGHVPTGGWARTVGRPATVLGSQCPVTGSRLSRLSRRSRESG